MTSSFNVTFFYPVAEYGTLCEYTRCILSYSSLNIWFVYLFIYFVFAYLFKRSWPSIKYAVLTGIFLWGFDRSNERHQSFRITRNVYRSKAAFIDSVETKICSLPNVLIQKVTLQLRIRRFPFRISAQLSVMPQSYSNWVTTIASIHFFFAILYLLVTIKFNAL